MKYKAIGYDENNNIVREMIHEKIYNDFTDTFNDKWLADFYLRYVCCLEDITDKRSDREILLKKPIQGIKRIIAVNLELALDKTIC